MQTQETIFDFLKNSPQTISQMDERTVGLIREHKLSGYLFNRYQHYLPEKVSEVFRADFYFQSFVNKTLLEAYEEIEQNCQIQNLKIVRIKGVDLIHCLYESLGERHMSDIDVYVDKSEYSKIKSILSQKGFQKEIQVQFEASCFRGPFSKKLDEYIKIQIDVHTQLYWRQKKEFKVDAVIDQNIYKLSKEKHLFYLIVNWGYQDTFLGLSKLLDIVLFIRKYNHEIDWTSLRQMIKANDLQTLFSLTGFILSNHLLIKTPLNTDPSSMILNFAKKLMTREFLVEPKRNKLKFYFFKHIVKTSLKSAIDYDLIWIRAYNWKNLMRLFVD
jgi:hypothetical protein